MKLNKIFRFTILLVLFVSTAFSQSETLTNAEIVEMTKAGIGNELILKKIGSSRNDFDTSAKAMIEMKKAGVADAVIAAMLEMEKAAPAKSPPPTEIITAATGKEPEKEAPKVVNTIPTPKEALLSARTISFEKSSLNPSRQALEKELLKRKDWQQLNLTILRYKESADLFGEIGFVTGSLITHRYVYRIYDRRSGVVIAAGETTSWGSLAENMARHISKNLKAIAGNASK